MSDYNQLASLDFMREEDLNITAFKKLSIMGIFKLIQNYREK